MEERYSRNMLIKDFGEEGQAKLKAAKALVVGAGGLGSPALFYLTAAGVGTIGIVDDDVVNISNLQRQILHTTHDVGRRKTESAREKLVALNPDVNILLYSDRFTEENAERIISEYDFVVDSCDNYATKLLINDICVKMKKPYSHGAVVSMRGEVMTYVPGSACYRCVFEMPPEDGVQPTSEQTGILGSVAGIVGSIQATETIKYLTGMNSLITNRILIIDDKAVNFLSLNVRKRSSCICDILEMQHSAKGKRV